MKRTIKKIKQDKSMNILTPKQKQTLVGGSNDGGPGKNKTGKAGGHYTQVIWPSSN
ncbi:MAG: hypothetical protein AB8F95_05995 [Bacteroidia bacterium]